jgi:hypothetical protein
MSGVDVNLLSIATVGNNVSLLPGVEVIVLNDTLLPTITIDGTLTSAPVMNHTLLSTVTIDGTFISTPVINDCLLLL